MQLSRRSFLGNVALGTAAAATLKVTGAGLAQVAVAAATPAPLIFLNSNENAYGPSQRVLAAMREAVAMANRYPDQKADELTTHIARFHKVEREQVVRGNGSTEILRMAAIAFAGPGKKVVVASPTFEALGEYARWNGAEIVRVPLRSDFAYDLDAMLARVDEKAGLIYICNPNNPTGSLTPRAELEAFLHKLPAGVHVVVDEAYHHFADSPAYASFLDMPVNDGRLIVARTFSKVYGLAGMRLGYGISSPETINQLARFQLNDTNNTFAAWCGAVALEDGAGVAAAARRNAADRAEFMKQAAARGLKPIPSQANFLMMEADRPSQAIIEHFKKQNILIGRPFPPMDTFVRVSLGTPDEMREFWRVWDRLPAVSVH